MRNKSTLFLLLLAIISINGILTIPLFSTAANSALYTTQLSATVSGETNVCIGSTEVLYKTDSDKKNYVWSISAGGTITSEKNTNTIRVSWNTDGEQLVSVNYIDPLNNGETVMGELHVGVRPLPVNPETVTGPNRVCQGESNLVYSVPPIAGATDYHWMLPEGVVILGGMNTNSIKVSYTTSATSGNVLVYGSNDCGDGNLSDFYPVSVHPIPATPNITLDGDLLKSSATEGNQWYMDGTIIPGAIRQDYQAVQNGRYWSVVTQGGCSSAESNKLDVSLDVTGINEMNGAAIQIYPVPNNGQFTIKFREASVCNSKIQVYNNLGAIVYEKTDVSWDAGSSCFIDLPSVPTGTYAVVVQAGKYHLMKKMLITK